MNLIDLYIQEVTRRIPNKNRSDIALELESTIYDMLPENYTEENVNQVLETLGNPAILASKYSDQPMHLIGPKYFDVYVSLLKLIFPIAILISFITLAAVKFFNPIESGAVLETFLSIIVEGIGQIIDIGIQTFFWLTVTFVVIERVDRNKDESPLSMHFNPWKPEDLKHVTYIPKDKAIKKCEGYGSLFWTAIWGTTYFYADHLLGIYVKGEDGLRMTTPAFNQEVLMSFWPLVVLIISAEIALAIYKVIKKQWTNKLALFSTIYQIASVVIFIAILTHSNLFSLEFLNQISETFSTTPEFFRNSLVWGLITIFVFFAGWEIFDVYRKTKIKA